MAFCLANPACLTWGGRSVKLIFVNELVAQLVANLSVATLLWCHQGLLSSNHKKTLLLKAELQKEFKTQG